MDNSQINTILAKYENRECYNCGSLDVTNRCCWPTDTDKIGNKNYTESLDLTLAVLTKIEQDHPDYDGLMFDGFIGHGNLFTLHSNLNSEKHSKGVLFEEEDRPITELAALTAAQLVLSIQQKDTT